MCERWLEAWALCAHMSRKHSPSVGSSSFWPSAVSIPSAFKPSLKIFTVGCDAKKESSKTQRPCFSDNLQLLKNVESFFIFQVYEDWGELLKGRQTWRKMSSVTAAPLSVCLAEKKTQENGPKASLLTRSSQCFLDFKRKCLCETFAVSDLQLADRKFHQTGHRVSSAKPTFYSAGGTRHRMGWTRLLNLCGRLSKQQSSRRQRAALNQNKTSVENIWLRSISNRRFKRKLNVAQEEGGSTREGGSSSSLWCQL